MNHFRLFVFLFYLILLWFLKYVWHDAGLSYTSEKLVDIEEYVSVWTNDLSPVFVVCFNLSTWHMMWYVGFKHPDSFFYVFSGRHNGEWESKRGLYAWLYFKFKFWKMCFYFFYRRILEINSLMVFWLCYLEYKWEREREGI